MLASDFIDVMCQDNARQYTALHRAVIAGNYNAIKMLLDSPLFYEAHMHEPHLPW